LLKLSEVIYSRRKELGLTQEQVSRKLNVTRQALSNWKRGKNYPDIDILVKLTQIYNLSFDALIKGDKEIMKKINKDAQALRKQKN
jgi:transcriptional regulator with XRE-family HTH domain